MELWLRLRIRDFQLRELLRFGDYRVAVLRCLFSQIRHADIRTWPIDCGRVTPSSVDTPPLIVTVVRVETAGGTSCSFVRVRSCAAPAQWNHDNASGDRRTSFRRQRNTSTITTPLHSVGRYYRSLRTSRHVVVVSGGRRVIIGQVRASRVNVIVTTAVRDTTTKSGRRPYTYDNNNHGESFYGVPCFRVDVDGAGRSLRPSVFRFFVGVTDDTSRRAKTRSLSRNRLSRERTVCHRIFARQIYRCGLSTVLRTVPALGLHSSEAVWPRRRRRREFFGRAENTRNSRQAFYTGTRVITTVGLKIDDNDIGFCTARLRARSLENR